MTPLLKKLSNMFGGKSKSEEAEGEDRSSRAARIAEEIRTKAESQEAVQEASQPPAGAQAQSSQSETPAQPEQAETIPEPPLRRTVVQVPVIYEQKDAPPDDGKIHIKAEPSREGDQCKFMVNRPLFKGLSWYFPDFESADGSPLAERIFSLEEVESLLVHGSTAVVTPKDKGPKDWQPIAQQVGSLIRELLEEKEELISKTIVESIPPEEKIREDIQTVINEEVNPGVAGHGGRITLTQVEGNAVTIEMGGGCQGCSAADLTLKQGIHSSFRKAVPVVGAIYDETDHAAGQNPFYS